MNLWIINQYARTPDTPGLTRHYDIAKHLVNEEVKTKIFNSSFDLYLGSSVLGKKKTKKDNPQKMDFEGVEFFTFSTLPYKNNASFGRILNMWMFSRDVFKTLQAGNYCKPDIVIGSSMTLFAADAARKLAKIFGVPFVFEVRDLWPLTPIELGGYSKWHPFLLYLDYLDKKLAKAADLIITTAPLMKEYYKERFGLPDEKFLWITNGTDVEMFQKAQNNSQNAEEKKTFDIYYTGAHGLANGLDKILDQMHVIKEKFPQVRLFLVGDGPMKPFLQERTKKEELPVTFLDPVPKKDLPKILSRADALVMYRQPTELRRFGTSANKLADYHAAGKPIIAVGDSAEHPVRKSGAGILVKEIEDLPKAIEVIIQCSQDEREKIGNNGKVFAEEHYDWGKLAEKLANALEKLF